MATSDKLERMMNLAAALLAAERPVTAAWIAERVAGYPSDKVAFRKAFERDKAELRDLGVPITVEEIPDSYPPDTGYRIDRAAYELPDPGLAPDELAALRLALQAVRLGDDDAGSDGTEALWKLGGVVRDDHHPLPQATVASLPADPALVPLFTAVMERRTVTFTYVTSQGGQERVVDPWRLDNRRGRWYLTGHDHLREGERNFRLDRIDGPVELGGPGAFERPAARVEGGPGQPWLYGDGEPVVAELLVDADRARWARQQLGDDVDATDHPDGSVTFRVPVTSWPAFRGFVLSFLDRAELVGPDALRRDLVAWVGALAGEAS
ncbi:helix-turn-helix transcriptional regulator [Rhabdothermincola salaria]|uniref:helix-turn-helix transcriptional regulator n=1 Tax=Rhabdothermincola salaria TaxID=2903142 RepID=UPI001E3CEB9F|nr:WYL domain-containing protein [Rhabdothermincola salaria]MCD9623073.1 WYL domain-containing protein [Rhabdothermincola salaria]